jgi:hypothetical protein
VESSEDGEGRKELRSLVTEGRFFLASANTTRALVKQAKAAIRAKKAAMKQAGVSGLKRVA